MKDTPKIRSAKSVQDVISKRYKALPFTGDFARAIGTPELTGAWIIWGNSGNGKTRFTLQLAKYLTAFAKVAYNSLEEGMSLSFKNALVDVGMMECSRRFVLLDKESIDDLKVRLARQKSPDVIIIDSLQYTFLTVKEYKSLIDTFRNKLFIFISHAEGKNPEGTLAKKVRYDAFVKIWVEGFSAKAQSRYGGGEEYVIWPEGYERYWGENI